MPTISLALAGLDGDAVGLAPSVRKGGEAVRRTIEWAAGAGVRAVQLDAAAAGVRPRELDRSGRRDLAALLRRSGLSCSGLDLFIPPEHFVSLESQDRAVSGVLRAIDMASDLATLSAGAVVSRFSAGEPSVSLVLPPEVPADLLSVLIDRAQARGVAIADHAWPIGPDRSVGGWLGVGLDPATAIAAGDDPIAVVARLGVRVTIARLSDVTKGGLGGQMGVGGGARISPGSPGGRLDVAGYLAALASVGYRRCAVLDLRAEPRPAAAIARALAAAAPMLT